MVVNKPIAALAFFSIIWSASSSFSFERTGIAKSFANLNSYNLRFTQPQISVSPFFDFQKICTSIRYNYLEEMAQFNLYKQLLKLELNKKPLNSKNISELKNNINIRVKRLTELAVPELNSTQYQLMLSWQLPEKLSFNLSDPDFDRWQQLAAAEKYDALSDNEFNIIWNNIRIPKYKILNLQVLETQFLGERSLELFNQVSIQYRGVKSDPLQTDYYLPNNEQAYLTLIKPATALELCQFLPSIQIYLKLKTINTRFSCGDACATQNVLLEVQQL